MLARIQECILYREFSNGEILNDMAELINLYEADEEALKAREDQFFKSVNGLVELAGMYGFSGNIWHTYLTFLLVNHENAFSMASEIRGAIKGSINDTAKMISRFSRNCMILTSRSLTKCSELYAAG